MKTQQKVCDVVILQITAGGRDICLRALMMAGLVEGADFTIIGTSHGIDAFMKTSGRQLLITGIISDYLDDLKKMVEELKEKNPDLIVATYSSLSFGSFTQYKGFDVVIDKMNDDCKGTLLLKAIKDFQAGTLRRKV